MDKVIKDEDIFTLSIKKQSLSQMIKAGDFDKVENEINEQNFLIQEEEEHEVKVAVLQSPCNGDTCDILEFFDSIGVSPARIEHLLTFWSSHKEAFLDAQGNHLLVALSKSAISSHSSKQVLSPVISFGENKCKLIHSWDDKNSTWLGGTCFLVILK